MGLRVSHSQIRLYSDCGQRYKFHYIDRIREKYMHSALLFGTAVDNALNELLTSRNLEESLKVFEKDWNFGRINNDLVALYDCPLIVYSASDFDDDIVLPEDRERYLTKYNISPKEAHKRLTDQKSEVGIEGMSQNDLRQLNAANWIALRAKGRIMLTAYAEKVLPNIVEVLAIQKPIVLSNGEDTITGFADLVVAWKDGRILVMDNKTSSKLYDSDSAGRSQQLVMYAHALKAEYNVKGVGFIVMSKRIDKNKTKRCKSCGINGTESRAKTCDNMVEEKRCHGEWEVAVAPDCDIQMVINEVHPAAEDTILGAFDDATHAIKNGFFYKNLQACKNGGLICPYIGLCFRGEKKGLTEV